MAPQVHTSQGSSPQSKAAPEKTLTQAKAIGAQTASEEKPKVMLRAANLKTEEMLSALALQASSEMVCSASLQPLKLQADCL